MIYSHVHISVDVGLSSQASEFNGSGREKGILYFPSACIFRGYFLLLKMNLLRDDCRVFYLAFPSVSRGPPVTQSGIA